MASVTFDKASRVYPGSTKPAVDQLEIDIADGEFLVLVGPSGCGKSTSLRMLAGLEDVNGGAIRIGDRDVTHLPPKDRDIAMVFQNYALYPHMTVADNMGFALKIAGVNKTAIRAKVEEAAKMLDLTEYLDRKPKALSGGQRQRVAMGRAIVREPQVFLMDEPLSNLDAKLRVSTRTQIASLQRRLGITTVYVTHDQVEALTMGDRVAVLKDGLLQQVDSPRNMYDKPANLFVAGFIGSPAMNLVEVPITDGGVKFGNSVVPVSREALSAAAEKGDTTVTVGIRPEHFDIVEHGGAAAKSSRRTAPTPRPVWPSRSTSSRSSAPTASSTAPRGSAARTRTWSSASAAAPFRRRAPSCTSCRVRTSCTSSPPRRASVSPTDVPHPACTRIAAAPHVLRAGPFARRTACPGLNPYGAGFLGTPGISPRSVNTRFEKHSRTIPRKGDEMSPNHHCPLRSLRDPHRSPHRPIPRFRTARRDGPLRDPRRHQRAVGSAQLRVPGPGRVGSGRIGARQGTHPAGRPAGPAAAGAPGEGPGCRADGPAAFRRGPSLARPALHVDREGAGPCGGRAVRSDARPPVLASRLRHVVRLGRRPVQLTGRSGHGISCLACIRIRRRP